MMPFSSIRIGHHGTRPRARPGNHQLARHRLRSRRPITLHSAQREFRQIFPKPGWVEHDPEEIWTSADLDRGRSAGRGLACGRATWPRSASPTSARPRSCGTARPASPSPTPSSGRTGAPAEFCDRLRAEGVEAHGPRAHGPRARRVLLGHQGRGGSSTTSPGARASAEAGKLALRHGGQLARLAASRADSLHVTDASNASRTLLFNIHTGDWDDELAACLRGSRAACCPRVRALERGRTARSSTSARPRARAIARDRGRSAGGALRPDVHRARNDQEHLRDRLLPAPEHRAQPAASSQHRLLTTVAWKRRRPAAVRARGQRLHRRRGRAVAARRPRASSGSSSEIEALAATVPGQRRRVPRARPSPDSARRTGTRTRAARSSGSRAAPPRGHIARAALESIAFQVGRPPRRDAGGCRAPLAGAARGRRRRAQRSC